MENSLLIKGFLVVGPVVAIVVCIVLFAVFEFFLGAMGVGLCHTEEATDWSP